MTGREAWSLVAPMLVAPMLIPLLAVKNVNTDMACELYVLIRVALKEYDERRRKEPMDKTISETAVLDIIRKADINGWVKDDLLAQIDALPSVRPESYREEGDSEPCSDVEDQEQEGQEKVIAIDMDGTERSLYAYAMTI